MRKQTARLTSVLKPLMPSAGQPLRFAAATVLAIGGLGGTALADDPPADDPGTQVTAVGDQLTQLAQASTVNQPGSPSASTGTQVPVPPGNGGVGTFTVAPSPPARQNPYALADQLKLRGWLFPLPGAADTLDGGLFGLRNAAADYGISWLGFTTDTFEDNILRHGFPFDNNRKQQSYYGQLPTYNSSNAFFLMYDLRKYGIPDGQLTAGVYYVNTNWQPSAPNGIGLTQLNYYQTAFNGRLEVKAGYLENSLEFLGTQIGGNLSGGIFGDNSVMPYETGESPPSFGKPAINVKLNFPQHFYDKFGVQAATNPDGVQPERDEDRAGVRWFTPNSGAFIINEIGYRAPPLPGQMSTWIRAAANYNSGRFADLGSATGDRKTGEYGVYLLADRQLFQTAPRAFRGSALDGLYAGFSVMYSPAYLNAFSQYYEGRIYGFGLIPGRPFDQLTLVADRNVFSGYAVRLVRSFGELAHDASDTFTIAYSAHVLPGTNLNVGLAYTDNPTPLVYDNTASNTGSGLNVLANLFVFF